MVFLPLKRDFQKGSPLLQAETFSFGCFFVKFIRISVSASKKSLGRARGSSTQSCVGRRLQRAGPVDKLSCTMYNVPVLLRTDNGRARCRLVERRRRDERAVEAEDQRPTDREVTEGVRLDLKQLTPSVLNEKVCSCDGERYLRVCSCRRRRHLRDSSSCLKDDID